MTQLPAPDPTVPKDTVTATDSSPEPTAGEADVELPAVERSRFSQWLASFGLGEFQNPLLTRARPPAAPRRPAS
jgi:hypothetical protein